MNYSQCRNKFEFPKVYLRATGAAACDCFIALLQKLYKSERTSAIQYDHRNVTVKSESLHKSHKNEDEWIGLVYFKILLLAN